MTYSEIISSLSEELGLPATLIDRTYRAYWKVVKMHVTSLPLKKNLSDEEFKKLQPNVNIPSLGKLFVTPTRYQKLKDLNKHLTELKKKQQ